MASRAEEGAVSAAPGPPPPQAALVSAQPNTSKRSLAAGSSMGGVHGEPWLASMGGVHGEHWFGGAKEV